MATQVEPPRQHPLEGAVKAAIIVVLAIEAAEEIAHGWRRMSHGFARWWEGVEHRERRHLHEAEVGFLLRHLHR